VLVSTLIIGVAMLAAAVAPGWFTMAALAVDGIGEGPQLTALFTVRHREAPEHLRGRIFTTAASLKVGGLAVGAALAGPLAGSPAIGVTGCLLAAAGIEACAAGAYLLIRIRPMPEGLSATIRPGRSGPAAIHPDPSRPAPTRAGCDC
jgi:hypothetical protein